MSKLFNRAKMTTATTGTGNLTLGSAASGFVTFATAGVVNGDVVRYCIEAENATDFEIGEGTYTASGTVLSRADADVQLSSNSNNRITLAAGTHNVFITAADSDFTQEIIVTVANAGAGNKYVIDGTSQQIITLLPSITYRLDQSDSSNATHPLVLASGSADGSTYSTGVRTVGTPGSKGAYTEVKLEQDAPALWYKCSNHSGMGASVNTGAPSGGVTSVANQAAMLAISSPSVGDMVYRSDNAKLMMYNGSGWYVLATIQSTPTVSSVSQTTNGSTSAIASNGTFAMTPAQNTVVTISGADADEGSTLTYSATVTSGTQSNVLASITNSSNVFTLAPATSIGGTITIRFDVSDSTAVGNQSASFSIGFSILNTRYTSRMVQANAAGNNSSFIDGSSAGHTITPTNAPLQGSVSPLRASGISQGADIGAYSASSNGASAYFGGTDYLTTPSNAAFALGTGAFTISAWIKKDAQGSTQTVMGTRTASSDTTGWSIDVTSSNAVQFYTNAAQVTGGTIAANTWYFITVTYDPSSALKLFINGSVVNTGTQAQTLSKQVVVVGAYGSGTQDWQGFISDVRIVKGTATEPSASPTAPLTNVTNTSLLLNFASAKVFDHAGVGNLGLISSVGVQATSSSTPAEINSGDFANTYITDCSSATKYITAPDRGGLSGAFTIETYLYATQSFNVSYAGIIGTHPSSSGAGYLAIVSNGTSIDFYAGAGAGHAEPIWTGLTIPQNSWFHFAIQRSATNLFSLYINGTKQTSGNNQAKGITAKAGTVLGGNLNDLYYITRWHSDGYSLSAYLQDFRISDGLERYTTNFTPHTTPLEA